MGFQLPNPPQSAAPAGGGYWRDADGMMFEYYVNDTNGIVNNGWTPGINGVSSTPTYSDADWIRRVKRLLLTQNNPAGSSGISNGFNGGFWRTSGVSGGFIFRTFFGTGPAFPANCGFFSGLIDFSGSFTTTPSTNANNMCGVFLDSGGNWGAIARTPANASVITTTTPRVVSGEQAYFFEMRAVPGSSEINYLLQAIDNTNGSFATIINGAISSNLPPLGTIMYQSHSLWTGATAPGQLTLMQGQVRIYAPFA